MSEFESEIILQETEESDYPHYSHYTELSIEDRKRLRMVYLYRLISSHDDMNVNADYGKLRKVAEEEFLVLSEGLEYSEITDIELEEMDNDFQAREIYFYKFGSGDVKR